MFARLRAVSNFGEKYESGRNIRVARNSEDARHAEVPKIFKLSAPPSQRVFYESRSCMLVLIACLSLEIRDYPQSKCLLNLFQGVTRLSFSSQD